MLLHGATARQEQGSLRSGSGGLPLLRVRGSDFLRSPLLRVWTNVATGISQLDIFTAAGKVLRTDWRSIVGAVPERWCRGEQAAIAIAIRSSSSLAAAALQNRALLPPRSGPRRQFKARRRAKVRIVPAVGSRVQSPSGSDTVEIHVHRYDLRLLASRPICATSTRYGRSIDRA